MKAFKSLEDLGAHLLVRAVAERKALEDGLEAVAKRIEKTARDEMGTYQSAAGPYPAWADLAASTQADRVRQGYTPDDPLLRSGVLRDTFCHQRDGLEAVIGSTDEKMIYHEFGTSKMPPRPVFGPAAIRNEKAIKRIMGGAVVAGIVGGSLTYEREVGDD